MIFDQHVNLKYKYDNRYFWCRGYYIDKVGKHENMIREYINNQFMNDQLSLKEFVDLFTGESAKRV